jgi:excisionase family DNA binding protein
MLGLSKSRVYVLSGQGKLKSYKVGNRVLFFNDEMEQYIRSGGKFNAKKMEAL